MTYQQREDEGRLGGGNCGASNRARHDPNVEAGEVAQATRPGTSLRVNAMVGGSMLQMVIVALGMEYDSETSAGVITFTIHLNRSVRSHNQAEQPDYASAN